MDPFGDRYRVRMILMARGTLAASALVLALTPIPAHAHWDYYASPTGIGMVPPTSSPAEATFHGKFPGHTQCPEPADDLMLLITTTGLQGTPTAASLWIGAEGTIGKLFARFPLDATGVMVTRDECWELDGNMYVIIETDRYPAGEIRGHIHMEVSMPVEARSWGVIKHTYR